MQGLGNDYLYFDCTSKEFPNPEQAAIFLSDRHFGVGADGIILIAKSDIADFRMIMFNADGSEGKMCGNGIRCIGKYVYEKGFTKKNDLKIETRGGVKELKLKIHDNKVSSIEVDMGVPIFNGLEIPTTINSIKVLNEPLTILGREFLFSSVSMGNPHCVIFVPSITDALLNNYGPLIEHHQNFPERVNVEFVEVVSKNRLKMRVWERGSGETLACGTGASAVAVMSHELGYTNADVVVELLGGDLRVIYREDKHVINEGPAEFVFEGTVPVTW